MNMEPSMNTGVSDTDMLKQLLAGRDSIVTELKKVIIGQDRIIEDILISLLCRGHCLLIGVPGLAKTLLISTLSDIMDLQFSRIQFTPDLMPSDITGTEILEEDKSSGKKIFKFIRGPVFSNIVLADEINRTPPKTQAALLQAMQEHEVSIAGETFTLDEPFFVLATQNPIEQEGTYPLPEAQLDRFMFSLIIDYPERDEEVQIVRATTAGTEPAVNRIIEKKSVLELQNLVRRVPVSDIVVDFAVDLARKTRPGLEGSPQFITDFISWGAGPRASQFLILGAKAAALLNGRTTPDINDVKRVAHAVLQHRIVINFNAEADGITPQRIIDRLLEA